MDEELVGDEHYWPLKWKTAFSSEYAEVTLRDIPLQVWRDKTLNGGYTYTICFKCGDMFKVAAIHIDLLTVRAMLLSYLSRNPEAIT